MSSLLGGGGGDSAPQAPPYIPINIADITKRWLAKDEATYAKTDEQWAADFPGLASARKQAVDQAYEALTGPIDPTIQSEFLKGSLSETVGNIGGGGRFSGSEALTEGSFGKGATSASMARKTESLNAFNQARLDALVASNPSRLFGPGKGDIIAMALQNQTGATGAAGMQYQAGVAQANADFARQQASYSALANTIGGVSKAYGSYNRGGYYSG